MHHGIWALAHLTPEQEQLLKEAERTLGDGVLLAYTKTDTTASDLIPTQLECLQGLEQKLGMVVISVRPSQR